MIHTSDKFQLASERFSFHFREVYEKCIEFIRNFFMQINEGDQEMICLI